MKTRSRQEMFDIVAVHLIRQQEKSKSESSGLCLYRGPRGLKCAVGALIPSRDYRIDFEEENVVGNINLLRVARVTESDDGFLSQLQKIHDSTDVEQWPEVLIGFAESNSLDLTALADEMERL